MATEEATNGNHGGSGKPPHPSTPASSSPGANDAINNSSFTTTTSGKEDTEKSKQREEKLLEQKRKLKRQKILRRLIPLLLTVPWFAGLIWTALHPLVSVITGEAKCRGQYIDENGLDVHRHRVESYPLERVASSLHHGQKEHAGVDVGTTNKGMCNAIRSMRLPGISPSVECLHHEATESIAFDVVRILPPMGPMIESTEAVVLVVGDHSTTATQQENSINYKNNKRDGDWYERSDLNASILYLIKKLGNRKDCPWLTKTVFIVSPSAKTATATGISGNNDTSSINTENESLSLGSVVDAFITSYMGDNGSGSTRQRTKSSNGNVVRPLPPDFTFPMIRSVLVINDVVETTTNPSTSTSEVRILPQGISGALPNLDLVFATVLSLQSHPAGGRVDSSRSLYHGDSEFRSHPFGGAMEERVGRVLKQVGDVLGLKRSDVEKYAKDAAGLFGFVAGLAIGPRQPHASALDHGIDALTIEVHIPNNRATSSDSIHPHYADLTRCLEHLLRSISNLHERLHHSIAQYTMPSPSKFVSHGEYVYPAILVSLPMVVRAATLALRDLNRFQFLHVGMVLGSVCLSASIISLWGVSANRKREAEHETSDWVSHVVFSISYLLVILVARQDNSMPLRGVGDKLKKIKSDTSVECRKSLRFVACLLGIYLHVPLLLANYSLGLPSSVFWSPLLATLVLPPSLSMLISRSKVLLTFSVVVKCIFLIATLPPILLVPRIFPGYTTYVICVYTPLHLLLTAMWLA